MKLENYFAAPALASRSRVTSDRKYRFIIGRKSKKHIFIVVSSISINKQRLPTFRCDVNRIQSDRSAWKSISGLQRSKLPQRKNVEEGIARVPKQNGASHTAFLNAIISNNNERRKAIADSRVVIFFFI